MKGEKDIDHFVLNGTITESDAQQWRYFQMYQQVYGINRDECFNMGEDDWDSVDFVQLETDFLAKTTTTTASKYVTPSKPYFFAGPYTFVVTKMLF